jgi:hypothetical protein
MLVCDNVAAAVPVGKEFSNAFPVTWPKAEQGRIHLNVTLVKGQGKLRAPTLPVCLTRVALATWTVFVVSKCGLQELASAGGSFDLDVGFHRAELVLQQSVPTAGDSHIFRGHSGLQPPQSGQFSMGVPV